MPRDAADLAAQLTVVTEAGFRNRLLARGQAQSMIRREGTLPDGAPSFSAYLDRDLLEYGYSLMSTALRILEVYTATEPRSAEDEDSTEDWDEDDDSDATGTPVASDASDEAIDDQIAISRNAFLQASYALEAATRNANPDTSEIAFHRLIAGAASHMAGYAARAFSLVEASRSNGRLSPMELTLADLVMRDLGGIEERTLRIRSSPELRDDALTAALSQADKDNEEAGASDPALDPEQDPEALDDLGPITLLLSEHYLSSVSAAMFAIAFDLSALLAASIADLRLGEDACNDIAAPGPWWVFRLTRHMIADLNQTSIRANLPTNPPHDDDTDDTSADESDDGEPGSADWARPAPATRTAVGTESLWHRLRHTYIAALMARDRSEIDLWPSQLHVVDRIFDSTDDLVVALPTSAGKTRIAELCILRCLAQKRRAVYVTPLRALSAQTERILEETFAPLGATVSSLYGSMGANDLDGDVLRSSDIVVATPEKLDFAIRSEPSVLDDVGVVVLDEGHMIGAEEREVRYEAQIQRLLRRADADTRRIICLSAVFPENEELDDFVGWITDDADDGLHKEDWRPTRQQFGLVEWRNGYARLTVTVGEDQPFIPRYFEAVTPNKPRRKAFPSDQNEMTLATAWRLVEEGQTVLIFCPLRVSVATLAALIVRLHRQGLLASLMPAEVDISNAIAVGTEWFGADDDILKCLRLGVAIHHGALPGPFRREVEALLHQRILKVTVASPTLAQGLNLSASVVLFSSLHRNRTLLKGSEFANVIGRAGRAFVDTEGLVLYPLFEPNDYKRSNWIRLTDGARSRALESGLILIGKMLLQRMNEAVGPGSVAAFVDYLTGTIDWSFPVVASEDVENRDAAAATWRSSLAMLDTAILSVIGDESADPADVIAVLADVMRDSLWERQMHRLNDSAATLIRTVVEQRAQFLWDTSTPAQRKGWYRAGLGADAGGELALTADTIVNLTTTAEASLADGDLEDAADTLAQLAAQVFNISTFAQTVPVTDWRAVLAQWLAGQPLSEMDEKQMDVAQFIESDIIYRLVWGIEAARVYEQAQGNLAAALVTGTASAALEAGTLSRPAAILLRSGFDHRSAAIKAVADTDADFIDTSEMREWIKNLDPFLAGDPTWPTESSRGAWVEFTRRLRVRGRRRWGQHVLAIEDVEWDGETPAPGEWLRINEDGHGTATLWSPGFDRLGTVKIALNKHREGVLHAIYDHDGVLRLRYRGPNDWLAATAGHTK
ncbi:MULTISPECIES: DEAD/DEAH box helicase [unclassified Mycobacterium]|uniref:DEAD/DEAH box helicase n=1 Tax=unclassified Mycobacterium TaxID=2642494 RepID=UPI0029C81546|nr:MULTISPECIES: DEAD/DEAH box helicase [unclassified Mycobacterium]